MKKIVALLLLACASLPAQKIPSALGGEPLYRLDIPHANPIALRSALQSRGYDVGCMASFASKVEVVVSSIDHDQLQAAGLPVQIVETAMPLWLKLSSRNGFPGYHDLAGLNTSLNDTAAANPGLAMVVDAAATWGPGATFEGRPINVIKISDNVAQDEDEPEVLFVACHHCREIVTPEIALDIIERLVNGYGSDPQITQFVDNNEIWIAPTWNPDGLEHTWTVNNLWRKNRKPFAGGAFGVDLNRNYDLNWQAACGASNSPSSETYRGPSVASEEETQTMEGFARARRFAKVMDYHSSGREVLQTYRCAPLPTLMENYIDQEAIDLANAISPAFGWREPSADGEHYEWEIKEITSYSFLTETHTTFQPAYASAVAEAALVWPQAIAFLSKPIPLIGHVTDGQTGAPVAATIEIVGLTFSNGETRQAEPQFGRYHLWLPPGQHQVRFSAANYQPQTLAVTVTSAISTIQDVILTPAAGALIFNMSTSGGGTGDFTMSVTNLPPTTGVGLTLFSLDTSLPMGTGNIFGIQADALTLQSLIVPPFPGNPLHFAPPFIPGVYPSGTFTLPPGSVGFLPGTQVDGVVVAFTANYQILAVGQGPRITF